MIISVNEQKYTLQDFTGNEESFESFVEQNADVVFGPNSIYLSKTKIKSSSGIGVIPDGFLIAIGPPVQWYVVEIELASHNLFDHILNQITRFLNAVKDPDTQQHLLDFFDDQIQSEHHDKSFLIKQTNPEVFKFLWNLLKTPPTILIIIDERNKQLTDVINGLQPNKVVALQFKVFSKMDEPNTHAFLIEPLFSESSYSRSKQQDMTREDKNHQRNADSGEVDYWITSVKDDSKETAEEAITSLVGRYGIYGFGESTGGRRTISEGDFICFYRNGLGIVAHAKIASKPVRRPDSRIRNADNYPWTFDLDNAKVYVSNPVLFNENVRARLDAYQGKDVKNNWSWFVQSTHRITKHDFEILTEERR